MYDEENITQCLNDHILVILSPPVTNLPSHPSHGGTYMVEGCLLLGSDWLVVGSEPCLPFTFTASPCIVPVRCILSLSRVSGFGVALSLLSSLS